MAYNMRDDIKEVYFTEEQLHEKVAELGARITEDYRDKNPLIVSVLKGSYVFMADLTRAIDTPCNVDFMVVSSYGQGTKTSREARNAALSDADPCSTRRKFHPPVHAALQAGAPQDSG